MKVAGLFLLPLLAGYAFASIWSGSRYVVAREDGNRLYFRAGFYALFLYTSSCLCHFIFKVYAPETYTATVVYLQEISSFFGGEPQSSYNISRISIALFSIIMSLSLAHLLNGVPWIKRKAIRYAIRNDDFEKIVERSMRKSMPLSVTLSSGKVYIGFAVRSFDPLDERKDLRVLPLLSGYRDDKRDLVLTTNYKKIYDVIHYKKNKELEYLDIGDFEIVIACREIHTCSQFDLGAYLFFKETKTSQEDSTPPIIPE